MYVFMYFDMFYILWPSGQSGSMEFENKVKVDAEMLQSHSSPQ
jgi:hypothetical protein